MWNPNLPKHYQNIFKSTILFTRVDLPCGTLTLQNIIKLFLNQRIFYLSRPSMCNPNPRKYHQNIFKSTNVFYLSKPPMWNPNPRKYHQIFLNQRIFCNWVDCLCGTLTLQNIIKIFLSLRILFCLSRHRMWNPNPPKYHQFIFKSTNFFLLEQTSHVEP